MGSRLQAGVRKDGITLQGMLSDRIESRQAGRQVDRQADRYLDDFAHGVGMDDGAHVLHSFFVHAVHDVLLQ